MKSSLRTVDLVVTGEGGDAFAAAVDAARRGRRVLVVLRSADTRVRRRFRRCLRRAVNAADSQIAVMTNAEVVCVDGVHGVEAVVVRHARTGRLSAVNASAFLSCDERDELSGASDRCSPGSRAPRTSRRIQ
jgi:thioredoxin reductase